MAVAITVRKRSVRGNERASYVDITGPASYATGGEALSQGDLNKLLGEAGSKIGDITRLDAETGTAGHSVVLDRANSKVLYFNGTTQIAAAVNLSGVTVRAEVVSAV